MKPFFMMAIIAFFCSQNISAQILTWNFFGQTSPVTLASTSNSTNILSSTMTRGAGAASFSKANSFSTVGFKDDGISTANTDYFQFTVQAATGYLATVTGITATTDGANGYSSTPGVTQQFAYSLDGTTFTLIGTPIIITGSNQSNIYTFDAATLAALQNIPSNIIITFRYYASGKNTTGDWGFYSSSATLGTLSVSGATVLPLSISDLNLSKINHSVSLGWSLGCTSNEVTYSVERSANGTSFGAIETKTVSQQRCSLPFQFTDAAPLKGTNYYRVKSSNIDGEFIYSQIAAVKFEGSKGLKVFPTITTGSTTIYFETSEAGKTVFNIMDMNGRLVKTLSFSATPGANNLPVNISDLPAGKYMIAGLQNNNKFSAVSIIKE